ncbi:glycosyltransferase family 2 protein [Lichenicoccus roseus]|uniref:Glycosyltransferase family 2 protein n=1 Tax=Lichenicoccus roseus TaxID=2683649 RepID=A0A5R9J575_9PROT|nr:glycosyltransferase family 2 protein [Lichenicoccus roseus]TLU72780.1 glycosyltransferase family 2 protein [Lichenicoccus roseus]
MTDGLVAREGLARAPLAIVTMVYNEGDFLPVWLRHYCPQVTPERCHVIDHGSDDGSTAAHLLPPGLNLLRIPRSPQDDERRAGFVSQYCAALLSWYESVIYVDVDEMLVADPLHHVSLASFAASLQPTAVATAIGLDVVHRPADEAALDWTRPISLQRQWLRFSSSMCKPALIRRPIRWAPGFHNIEAEPEFSSLYLFHLRYADMQSGLQRLARTRAQAWSRPEAGSHQRVDDADWTRMLHGIAGLPRRTGRTLDADDPELQGWLGRVQDSATARQKELFRIDLHLSGDALWRLPQRFAGSF